MNVCCWFKSSSQFSARQLDLRLIEKYADFKKVKEALLFHCTYILFIVDLIQSILSRFFKFAFSGSVFLQNLQ